MAAPRALAALFLIATLGACTPGGAPARPGLTVRQAELWYATAPAPGVWVELRLVLDNPVDLEAERTVLRLPAALLEDFTLRDAEPPLLGPPVREPDGRYAFVFPAPLDRSLNWYRLFLAVRREAPRPFQVAIAIERAVGSPPPRLDVPAVTPRTRYVDREADPFWAVPEDLVAWLPSRPAALLPLLTVTASILAVTAAAGCLAAFWLQKR